MSELIKKPASEWYKYCKGLEIIDPDGFRPNYDVLWNYTLMSKEEFDRRLIQCTCKFDLGYFTLDEKESEGTKLAAELRAACNNMTEEERDNAFKRGMKLIYHNKQNPKIVLVSGHARNGKDTFSNGLTEINNAFQSCAFAFALKEAVKPLIRENFGWDVHDLTDEQKKIVRPILIAFGCAMREIDIDFWVKKVDKIIEEVWKLDSGIIPVISDCRFLSEYQYFANKYGANNVVLVEVIRKGAPTPPDEELKNQPLLRPYVDYTINWPTFLPNEKEFCQQYVKQFHEAFFN